MSKQPGFWRGGETVGEEKMLPVWLCYFHRKQQQEMTSPPGQQCDHAARLPLPEQPWALGPPSSLFPIAWSPLVFLNIVCNFNSAPSEGGTIRTLLVIKHSRMNC